MNEVGGLIRRLRLERKLNQAELGDIIGKDGATISRLERGKSAYTSETLEKISTAFGMTAAEFLAEAQREDSHTINLTQFIICV